jgi:hypothetical protein
MSVPIKQAMWINQFEIVVFQHTNSINIFLKQLVIVLVKN